MQVKSIPYFTGSAKVHETQVDGKWFERQAGLQYGLWQLVRPPYGQELPTTSAPLGQVCVWGILSSALAGKAGHFSALLEVTDPEAVRHLEHWREAREHINLGLAERYRTFSLEGVRVYHARPDEILGEDPKAKWFKLTIDASYRLSFNGAEQWPDLKKEAEAEAARRDAEQLYAYEVFPDYDEPAPPPVKVTVPAPRQSQQARPPRRRRRHRSR